jgi:hypothetical protein
VAITDYHPDIAALSKASTRVVIAVGEETGDVYTARTARSTARRLGHDAAVFPSQLRSDRTDVTQLTRLAKAH